MQALNLTLTDAARAAIDKFMEGLDYDESIPCLRRMRIVALDGSVPVEQWTVDAYHPDRVRFFEQLRANTGLEFFFKCDGLVLLLWQPALANTLHGRTLDYSYQRYQVL
jgi:hypothetical protein